MASIFSVQNLQTFLRRKNLPRPPGPPGPPGRPPGRPPGPDPGPAPGAGPGPAAGAPASGAFTVSSDMLFPLYLLGSRAVFRAQRGSSEAPQPELSAGVGQT